MPAPEQVASAWRHWYSKRRHSRERRAGAEPGLVDATVSIAPPTTTAMATTATTAATTTTTTSQRCKDENENNRGRHKDDQGGEDEEHCAHHHKHHGRGGHEDDGTTHPNAYLQRIIRRAGRQAAVVPHWWPRVRVMWPLRVHAVRAPWFGHL